MRPPPLSAKEEEIMFITRKRYVILTRKDVVLTTKLNRFLDITSCFYQKK